MKKLVIFLLLLLTLGFFLYFKEDLFEQLESR